MKDYKATPEQWKADKYDWSKADTEAMDSDSAFRCILELRARVEALEAQASNYLAIPDSSTPPSMATDEELDKTWNFEDTWNGSLRAVYNLGVAYGSGSRLRAARRPKPPTLNSIALQMLGTIERDAHYLPEITDTIRRALEALPE